jgi:enoyl-CoA hydratase
MAARPEPELMTATPSTASSELLVERRGSVAILRLHRPDVLNALSDSLVETLVTELEKLDRDPEVRCFVLTGGDKVFAAGADIKGMADAGVAEMMGSDRLAKWERLRKIQKPIVAAVCGFALGGGLELAMSCDLLVAAEDAVFGQPEILLGVIPGAGGTQRLTRAIGRTRAMEFILTGKRFSAAEGLAWGLVNRVVPRELAVEEAVKLAVEIASKAPLAVRLAKEAVNRALDADLETGLLHERRLFYLLFGTEDQKEGMRAFLEKRPAKFTGK